MGDSANSALTVGGNVNVIDSKFSIKTETHGAKRKSKERKPFTFNIDKPIPFFCGRECYLKEILYVFEEKEIAVAIICGLSGIGKSELVRQFASNNIARYQSLVWLDCSKARLRNSYTSLVAKMNRDLKGQQFDDIDQAFEHLTQEKCLIVFDDADEDDLEGLMPKLTISSVTPDILITSCSKNWNGDEKWMESRLKIFCITLGCLIPEEAVNFVKGKLACEDIYLAEELAERLYYHPRTLFDATVFIEEESTSLRRINSQPLSLKDYLLKLDTYLLNMAQKRQTFDFFEKILEKKAIQPLKEQTRKMLYATCYFADEPVSELIFTGNVAKNDDVRKITDFLASYFVIAVEGDRVILLPMIQHFCRIYFRKKGIEKDALMQAIDVIENQPINDLLESLRRHVISVWNHAADTNNIGVLFPWFRRSKKVMVTSPGAAEFELLKKMAKKGTISANSDHEFVYTVLVEAFKSKNMQFVQEIFLNHEYFNVRAVNSGLKNFLHLAVENGQLDIVKFLAENKICDLNARENMDKSVVHLAAKHGHLEIMKYLLEEQKLDVTTRGCFGRNAVLIAAEYGQLNIVEYLIEKHGVKADEKDNQGRNAVHMAVEKGGYLEIIKYLAGEVDVKQRDLKGKNAVHLAAEIGKLDIISYLIEQGGVKATKEDNNGNNALHLAAEYGHLDIIKYLVNFHGLSVMLKNANGLNAVHLAASHGHLLVIKSLIERYGADIHEPSVFGRHSLILAAMNGHLCIVQYLIEEQQVSQMTTNYYDSSSIHYAAEYGHIDIVKYLINNRGIDASEKGYNGQTPVHFAAKKGNLDVIRYLIVEQSVNAKEKDRFDNNAVHLAAVHGDLNTVRYLIEEHDVNAAERNCKGQNALLLAAKHGHLHIVRYLIEVNGMVTSDTDRYVENALHKAAFHGHLHIAEYLVGDNLINPSEKNRMGYTALKLATHCGHSATSSYLMNFEEPATEES